VVAQQFKTHLPEQALGVQQAAHRIWGAAEEEGLTPETAQRVAEITVGVPAVVMVRWVARVWLLLRSFTDESTYFTR